MADFVEPRGVVMRPFWQDTVVRLLPNQQPEQTSDPEHRVWIPAGIVMIQIKSEMRFAGTVMFRRTYASTDKTAGTLPAVGELMFTVASEAGAEMWINITGTPNTNDQANTRIAVTIIPVGLRAGGGG